MRSLSLQTYGRLVLLLVLIGSTLASSTTHAQGPLPSDPRPEASSTKTHIYDAQSIFDTQAPGASLSRLDLSSSSNQPQATSTTQAPADPTLPAPETPLLTTAEPVVPAGIQGIVKLDVAVVDTIRAGEYITYTYIYTNTGTAATNGIEIATIWDRFNPKPNSDWQFCIDGDCNVLPGSVQGPSVTRIDTPPPAPYHAHFSIGNLAANQSGRFSIRLGTRKDLYPRTGSPVTRPSGSGSLFLAGATAPTSEDTAASIVIGPVLVPTKIADANQLIYPTESAGYTIRVGNATGRGDSSGGQIRPDTRNATSIVLIDTFPTGGNFVSATGNPTVDLDKRTVTWQIPGPLKPGQTVEFRIVFSKADVAANCGHLRNGTYSVTSAEYPLDRTERYKIQGSGEFADVPVVTPVVLKASALPNRIVYGEVATETIVVQNFWSQPLTGVQLSYTLQNNVYYQAGSATPTPTTAPDSTKLGGVITWTFDIPAGSKTSPSEATFKVTLRADYIPQTRGSTVHVKVPAGVPAACITDIKADIGVSPRLTYQKITDADPSTIIGNAYQVFRSQHFPYIIEITNNGSTDATEVSVIDSLPGDTGAAFSFVSGSATFDGEPREPDSVSDGQGGTLIWNNLRVRAGETARLIYMLNVDGRDFYRYCNRATVTSGQEALNSGQRQVCVKINPDLEVIKTVDRTNAAPGEEIQFTLTLTNHEATAYEAGLVDYLNQFTFVRQVSGYRQPDPQTRTDILTWPIVSIAPGATIAVTIVARVPSECATRDYRNEALFQNRTDIIHRLPPMVVNVHVTCGKLKFAQSINRNTASLQDQLLYTLQLHNTDGNPISNITVEELLAPGFKYVGLDGSSDIRSAPIIQLIAGNRYKLTWPVATIAAGKTLRIKFIATSGDIVGTSRSLMVATPDGQCETRCVTNDDLITYSFADVAIQPLITMEPKIVEEGCAKPGEKRTYQLAIINTNTHDYGNTAVTVTLPYGLSYVRAVDDTPAPTPTSTPGGGQLLTWTGLRVPAKPGGTFASQVTLRVELEVGQVLGNLATIVETTSPDGLIPRKDGVSDPTVLVCQSGPAIAMAVDHTLARINDDLIFRMTLANPTGGPLQVSVKDVLPSAFTYRSWESGIQPVINGQTLTWTNITIPAASGTRPGVLSFAFKVQLTSGTPNQTYTNTGQITASPVAFDTTYSSASVTVATNIYFIYQSLIQR